MDIISYVKARKAGEKADSVQEQLNQAVQDGDSLEETQQARVDEKGASHDTLKDRLDFEQQKTDQELQSVTTQLAQTVKKGEGGAVTWSMASQDLRENITGGTTAVVGVDSVLTENIVNGAVTIDKFSPDIKDRMEALMSALVVEGEEWGSQ